jgi:hypothetical protein
LVVSSLGGGGFIFPRVIVDGDVGFNSVHGVLEIKLI